MDDINYALRTIDIINKYNVIHSKSYRNGNEKINYLMLIILIYLKNFI